MAHSLAAVIFLAFVATIASAGVNDTTTTATTTVLVTPAPATPAVPAGTPMTVSYAFSVAGPLLAPDAIIGDAAANQALSAALATKIAADIPGIAPGLVQVVLGKATTAGTAGIGGPYGNGTNANGTSNVARRLAIGNLQINSKINVPVGVSPAAVAAIQNAKTPAQLVQAFNAAIATVPALAGKQATGAAVQLQAVIAALVTTTSTWTAWDSSSGSSGSSGNSLGSLSGVNASSSGSGSWANGSSLNRGSSVSGSSLPGWSSGDSSGSNASGSSGSYLQIWQWLLLLGCLCCCKGGCIAGFAGGSGKAGSYSDEEELIEEGYE